VCAAGEAVEHVVRDVIRQLELAAGGRALPIHITADLGGLEATREQLTYVLRNLIGNALGHDANRDGLLG
jgi:signal transduction histidine kinase